MPLRFTISNETLTIITTTCIKLIFNSKVNIVNWTFMFIHHISHLSFFCCFSIIKNSNKSIPWCCYQFSFTLPIAQWWNFFFIFFLILPFKFFDSFVQVFFLFWTLISFFFFIKIFSYSSILDINTHSFASWITNK